MDEKLRERVALFRFSVIGSLISGELAHGDLNKNIMQLSGRRYQIPDSVRTHIGAGTIREWLADYRKGGFEALKPKGRCDAGTARVIRPELAARLVALKTDHPKMAVTTMFRELLRENIIKPGEVAASTVYRLFARSNLSAVPSTTGKEQRRFVHRYPNDCWQSDVMHGPYIKDGPASRARKTYLIAFIDDASRVIVGAQFFFSEATVNIKTVLRQAVLTYGVPSRLYLDNGRNFCAEDIRIACAAMRTALIHTTPYYPEGKGKIERFFRTVRSSFLTCLRTVSSLGEINLCFDHWLQNDYNRASHDGIAGDTPMNTFLRNADSRIRRLPPHIDPAELFNRKESRRVARDGTFHVNNILYQAEEHLIGKTISILYDLDDPSRKVKVYDGDLFVHAAYPVDFNANAVAKRKEI
jgi:putative transposase